MKRWFFYVGLLAALAACSRIDGRRFQGLATTSRGIETAVTSRAGLQKYRELIGDYDRELASAKAGAQTPTERSLVGEYEAARTGLQDILLVWEARDARGSDMLPMSDVLSARIAREYSLGVNTNDPPSIYAGEAMQAIWDATKTKLASANAAAFGG